MRYSVIEHDFGYDFLSQARARQVVTAVAHTAQTSDPAPCITLEYGPHDVCMLWPLLAAMEQDELHTRCVIAMRGGDFPAVTVTLHKQQPTAALLRAELRSMFSSDLIDDLAHERPRLVVTAGLNLSKAAAEEFSALFTRCGYVLVIVHGQGPVPVAPFRFLTDLVVPMQR